MSFDEAANGDAQQLLLRASELMFEALMLLDRAQAIHSAALLDHAIALLPIDSSTAPVSHVPTTEDYCERRSSIRR